MSSTGALAGDSADCVCSYLLGRAVDCVDDHGGQQLLAVLFSAVNLLCFAVVTQ